MRKLVSHLLLTLDGAAVFDASVIGTIIKLRDDEVEADFFAHLAHEDAMLLGRATYAEWAEYWPTSTVEPFASHINRVPKYVVSKTLSSAPWGNREEANVLQGALVDAVTELKHSSGRNIGVHGSPSLVASLMHADLLDELRLEIYPVIAGTGARLFGARTDVKQLDLTRSTVTANGVAILTYGPRNSRGFEPA